MMKDFIIVLHLAITMTAATIDDLVTDSTGLGYIGQITNNFRETYKFVKAVFNYGLLTAAGLTSYAFSGLAGPVTGSAMMLGKVLMNFRKKIKTEWGRLYKEGWKGLFLGNLAKIFYQNVISAIPNKTFYGKIGRALAYNPGFMGFVYNPTYLTMTKMLDNKIPQKGEWWNLTKRIFKYNFVPHYITTNYIENVQQQVAASAFLGTAYRVIAG